MTVEIYAAGGMQTQFAQSVSFSLECKCVPALLQDISIAGGLSNSTFQFEWVLLQS